MTMSADAVQMMYLALTYDHRLLDGREAVTFLVKVKVSSNRLSSVMCSKLTAISGIHRGSAQNADCIDKTPGLHLGERRAS